MFSPSSLAKFMTSNGYNILRLFFYIASIASAVVMLGLVASATKDGFGYSRVYYLIACSTFSLAFSSVPFIIFNVAPRATESFGEVSVLLFVAVVNGIAMVLYLVGGIIMEQSVAGASCGHLTLSFSDSGLVNNWTVPCNNLKAAGAMGFIAWAVFLGLFIFNVIELRNATKAKAEFGGSEFEAAQFGQSHFGNSAMENAKENPFSDTHATRDVEAVGTEFKSFQQ